MAPGVSNVPVIVEVDFLVAQGISKCASAAIIKARIERVKKAQGHHAFCARREEKTEPATKPVGPQDPKMAKMMLRFLPMGKVIPIRAMALGNRKAGPMPWKARQMVKTTELDLKLKPVIRDQIAYQSQPRTKTRLCPSMSPTRPAGRIKVPTVRLKAAVYQLRVPGSCMLKLSPMIGRGATV